MSREYTAYLAGAMTGVSEEQSREWRKRIKDAFYQLGSPYQCFDPWDHFSFNDPEYDPKESLKIDLWNLKRSNVMIVELALNPGSLGTMAELSIAYDHNIPIIALYNSERELHEWQYNMVDKFFDFKAAADNGANIYTDVACYVSSHYRRSSFG